MSPGTTTSSTDCVSRWATRRCETGWRVSGAQQSRCESKAVLAHLIEGNARVALHDDELSAWIGAFWQFPQPFEIICSPDAGQLREEFDFRELAGIPMQVIVEKVAVEFGNAGVK